MSKENKINYEVLEEITVTSQTELDMIPDKFKGRIYIESDIGFDRPVMLTRVFPRHVEARGNSYVIACRNASVKALENASVEAWENAYVEAGENASVEAGGNVRVVAGSSIASIQISGNARIVYYPKNIEDFMNFYGIKHDKKTAIFYKAVHRREVSGKPPIEYQFVSDYRSDFEYPIGSIVSAKCDMDVSNDCSYGINISYLGWAINFGRDWADMAIIEVETKIKDIVLPTNTNGKVRTSEVKVLREVPLEECGVFGKFLARKRRGER